MKMSLRTLMQAGPAKANELFARLSETSDGAVRTREKLFADLKTELELHARLEEQHLFPILRRNAETKELVGEALRDNKELRAKLAELDALQKNDETFSEHLKALQKTFRQHARDEKRELLPAVQRALSEEQVQNVTEKIEAGIVEAEQAKHDDLEARRIKARQEREQTEQRAVRQEAAERSRQIEQEAAAEERQHEDEDRLRTTVGQTITAAQTSALEIAQSAGNGAQRITAGVGDAATTSHDAAKTMAPDSNAVAGLPAAAVKAIAEIRSAWMDWMGETSRAGTQMSQDLLQKVVEQQRRFASKTIQGWMDHNARVVRTTMHLARASLHPFVKRFSDGSKREDDR
jgi:hypothetical protein